MHISHSKVLCLQQKLLFNKICKLQENLETTNFPEYKTTILKYSGKWLLFVVFVQHLLNHQTPGYVHFIKLQSALFSFLIQVSRLSCYKNPMLVTKAVHCGNAYKKVY